MTGLVLSLLLAQWHPPASSSGSTSWASITGKPATYPAAYADAAGVSTVALALSADPANCVTTGWAAQGIAASGAAQGCFLPTAGADLSGLQFVTFGSEAALSGERVLTAGTNTTVDTATTGQVKINVATGAGYSYTLPAATTTLGGTKMAGACTAGSHVSSIGAGGELTCSADSGYTLPAASTTLGGVKHAANCSAGQHVNGIGAAGELACSADTGSGAPATSKYIVQTTDAGLANAQALSALTTGIVKVTTTTGVLSTAASGTDYGPPTSGNATGLVLSTTTTGAHTAYAGTSCTNQFPRSLNASGAATCASVDLSTDTAATAVPATKGGTGQVTTTQGGVLIGGATNTASYTAGGAQGSVLYNGTANTPSWLAVGAAGTLFVGSATVPKYLAAGSAGQVLVGAGAADPVWKGAQSCNTSGGASATCTITVARSGCTPICSQGGSGATAYLIKAVVSTTTLTCTFSSSATTHVCNCLCP